MEEKVIMTLERYKRINDACTNAKEKVSELERQMKELVDGGKVAVVQKALTLRLFGGGKEEYIIEVKNLDDVKQEVFDHFKKQLFDEELSKSLGESMKTLSDQKSEIIALKSEIESLRNRSLWERILNR